MLHVFIYIGSKDKSKKEISFAHTATLSAFEANVFLKCQNFSVKKEKRNKISASTALHILKKRKCSLFHLLLSLFTS